MSFQLHNTAQAMKWCNQKKHELYEYLNRNDSQLMRLTGPFVGTGSALVTLTARVASVGEAVTKGLTNFYYTPNGKRKGVEQIVIQTPIHVVNLALCPIGMAFDILSTSARMLTDPKDYSQFKRDAHAEKTRLITERSAVEYHGPHISECCPEDNLFRLMYV